MADRHFLKRGAGTTDKYKINYPVMARTRQNERSSSLEKIDPTENVAHYASVPVRKTPNSAHEGSRTTSLLPLVYDDPQRPISSEGVGRTDSGRGSREAHTPEVNQRGKVGYQSPEFIAPDPLMTSRTNDSGLSESPVAGAEQDSQHYRNAFSDPDETRNEPLQGQSDRNRMVSLGAFPVNISEESQNHRPLSPSSKLSSLGSQRSKRVIQVRKYAQLVADDLKAHSSTTQSEKDTMDNVSEISSLTVESTRPVLMPSNRERQRVPFSSNPPNLQDSHFFERNIGPFRGYRPLEEVVPRSGVSLPSSIAAAVPSQATRRLPPVVERFTQNNSIDFPQKRKQKPETRMDEIPIVNQSLAFTPRNQLDKGLSTLESNLARQLRDTILNVDFAEAEMRQRFHELEMDAWIREQELEEKRKIQEEAIRQERAEVEREKANLGRLAKAQGKGSNEKENELAKQLDDAKQSNGKVYAQMIDLRNKLKRAETEAENWKKEKENERTRAERLQGRVDQLQSEVAVQRGRMALDKTRNEREIINNQKTQATLNLQTLKSFDSDTIANRPLFRDDSRISDALSGRSGKAENFHWADRQQPVTSPAMGILPLPSPTPASQWKVFSSEKTPTDRKEIYITVEGTKVGKRDCSCSFYKYQNGDAFWKSSVEDIEIEYKNGIGEVRFKRNFVIRLLNDGQFDLIRWCDGQTTTIQRDGTRLEKKLDASRRWITEKFTPEKDPLRTERGVVLVYAGISVWIHNGGYVKISTPTLQIFHSARNHMVEIYHVEKENLMSSCCYWGRKKRQEGRNQSSGNTNKSSDLNSLWDQLSRRSHLLEGPSNRI